MNLLANGPPVKASARRLCFAAPVGFHQDLPPRAARTILETVVAINFLSGLYGATWTCC